MLRLKILSFSILLTLISCSYTVEEHLPPEDIIERVTDMHLLSGGEHLLILNSDFDRSYDYGRLSIVKLGVDNDDERIVSSVLIDALGGKIVVSQDEKTVFVSTRAFGSLHKITIEDKDGVPHLSYAVGDSRKESSLTLHAEPYAMIFNEDETLLFVTHLMNGELIVVDVEKFEILHIFKLLHGASDIVYDSATNTNIVTYKDWAEMSAVVFSGTVVTPGIETFRLIPDMPERGIDTRSLAASTVSESVFYVTYRNVDAKGEEWPLIIRFKIFNDGVRVHAETEWMSPVTGRLGEIVQVSDDQSGSEWLFVAAVNEEVVYVIEGSSGNILWRIEADDCHPYQLHSSHSSGAWQLFVSCFSDNKILVYDVDSASDSLFEQLEVIQ